MDTALAAGACLGPQVTNTGQTGTRESASSSKPDLGSSFLPLILSIGLSGVVAGALFSLLPLGLLGAAFTVLAAIAWPFGGRD